MLFEGLVKILIFSQNATPEWLKKLFFSPTLKTAFDSKTRLKFLEAAYTRVS